MGFVELLKKRAKESVKTIVLPETEDMRTLEATDKILKEGVAKIILIGNEEEINKKAAEGGFDISGAQIVDPEKDRIIVYNFADDTMTEYAFGDAVKAGIYNDLEIIVE